MDMWTARRPAMDSLITCCKPVGHLAGTDVQVGDEKDGKRRAASTAHNKNHTGPR